MFLKPVPLGKDSSVGSAGGVAPRGAGCPPACGALRTMVFPLEDPAEFAGIWPVPVS